MKKILTVIIFSLFASACTPDDSMHENMQPSMQCGCCQGMMSSDNKNNDMSQCCCKEMMDGKMCNKKQSSQNSVTTKLKKATKAKPTEPKSGTAADHEQHH